MAKKPKQDNKPKEIVTEDSSIVQDEGDRITARTWMKRIKRGLQYRDKIRDDQNWKRILDEYKGIYRINNSSSRAIPINLVYGYVSTAIPRIYFRDPHMSVNPKGAESINAARIVELDVNYAFKQLNLKTSAKRLLIDAHLFGHGWFKLGYVSETGEMQGDPGTEPSEYIKNEEIFITYVPYEDIIFDTSMSKDPPHDCRWIAHRIIKTVEEMKGDKTYSNTGKLKSNVSTRDSRGDKIEDTQKNDNDTPLFEFWEVTDLETNKVYAVADNLDLYLREADYLYQMKGLPYAMLKFNDVPNEPYPLSDIYIIESQFLERIKIRSAQINHIKRWSRQLSVEEGAITKEEMEKFASGVDAAVIQRKKGFAPPVPIEYAPMQQEIFALDNLIQMDIDSVIGQSEVDRGGSAKTTTKTKYEVQEQQQGTSIRQAERQDKLEDFLEEVTDKYIALMKQFQTTPKYVRITGMGAQEIMTAFGTLQGVTVDSTGIHFTKEAIQGDYDIEAKAGSTLPLNRENKIKLLQLTMEAAPQLGIAPGSPASIAMAKSLFRELDEEEISLAFDQQVEMMKNAPPPAPPMPQGPPQPQNNTVHHVHHQGPPAVPSAPSAQQGTMPMPGSQ